MFPVFRDLAKPLLTQINGFQAPTDLFAMPRYSRAFRTLASEESFWRAMYLHHFKIIVFAEDYKPQFIATHFYQQSRSAKRRDQSIYYLNKLKQFLSFNGYENKQWALFFRSVLHAEPVISDFTDPIEFFILSIEAGDYRAAQYCAQVLHHYSHTKHLLISIAATQGTQFLEVMIDLLKARQSQIPGIILEIGILQMVHAELLAPTPSVNAIVSKPAESSFIQSLAHRPEEQTASYLALLLKNRLQNQEAVIAKIEELFHRFPLAQGHIAHTLGKIYYGAKKYEQALEWLYKAHTLNCANAAFDIALYYDSAPTEHLDKKLFFAQEMLRLDKGPDGKGPYAPDYNYFTSELLKQNKDKKDEGKDKNVRALLKLSALNGSEHSLSILAEEACQTPKWEVDPHLVVWVQTYALAFGQGLCNLESFVCPDSLKNAEKRLPTTPYVDCALAIIYSLNPDDKSAEKLKPILPRLKPEALKAYRDALVQEQLLEPYIDKLLEKWSKNTSQPKMEFKLT